MTVSFLPSFVHRFGIRIKGQGLKLCSSTTSKLLSLRLTKLYLLETLDTVRSQLILGRKTLHLRSWYKVIKTIGYLKSFTTVEYNASNKTKTSKKSAIVLVQEQSLSTCGGRYDASPFVRQHHKYSARDWIQRWLEETIEGSRTSYSTWQSQQI